MKHMLIFFNVMYKGTCKAEDSSTTKVAKNERHYREKSRFTHPEGN